MKHKKLLPITALAATMASPAHATLLTYEGFDGGTVNGQALSAIGAGSSSGFATAWASTGITTNNGGYTTGAGTGEAWSDVNLGIASNLQLSTTAGSSVGTATNHSRYLRTLDATAAAGVNTQSSANGTVWLSFMGQRNGTNLGGVELVNTTSSRFLEGFGGFSTNNWNWSDRVTAGTGEVFPVASTNEAFVTVQLVYGATSTTIRMFVNQTGNVSALTGVPSIENVIANTSNNRPNFNAISVYGGFKIDELRVGTTYADVAPVNFALANNAGASTWIGTTLTTTGSGSLSVAATKDVRFDGTAATVAVDGAGVTNGNGRLEFRTGGHTLSGGNITTANIANLAGNNSVLSSVAARYAEIASGSTLTLGGGTLTNGLYGSGALVKSGTGTLTLDRTNVINGDNNTGSQPILMAGRTDYTGAVTISQGKLSISRVTAINAPSSFTLGDANTGANNVELELNNRIDVGTAVTVSSQGSGLAILSASNTGGGADSTSFLGTVTLNRDTIFRGQVASDRLAMDGKITGTGNITVDGGARTTFLSTANDFVGNLLVTGTGTVLQASVATAAEVIPNGTSVTVDAGAVLQLASSSGTETINALNGAGTVRTFVGQAFGSGLTVGSANGSGDFTGALQNGNNPLSFTKIGSGTQTLSNTSTYTGATRVQNGTLLVNGSIAASAVTVEGGTLGGNGIVGITTMTSGAISPGNSPDTLDTGSLSLNGGTLIMELNGPTLAQYDQINVTGTVALGANIPLTLSLGYDPVDGIDSFVIINNDSVDLVNLAAFRLSYLGNPLDEAERFFVGGQEFSISYAGSTGNDIVLSAIPEPGAWSLALGGFALLALRRRRK